MRILVVVPAASAGRARPPRRAGGSSSCWSWPTSTPAAGGRWSTPSPTPGFVAARVDASDETAVPALIAERGVTALLNATDPRFVMPLFRVCLAAGVTYLDMAMSLPHATASPSSTSSACATARTWASRAAASRRRSRSGR